MESRTDAASTRRSFLSAAGAAIVGGALATGTASAAESTSFHLTQGEHCIPLRPLRGDDPVKAFYDYRNERYSSHGTQSLQRADTSLLFLYEGPKGVSLVFVHGKLGSNSDGGSVTFEISGLPSSGKWLVEDDSYDGPRRYDRWKTNDTTATIDWTWDGGRADGAVFGYLGDDTDIEIDPAFNEDAALFGKHYDGTIEDWQALSGDRSNPTRTSLDRSTPIRIESGPCPTGTSATTTRESSTTHGTGTARPRANGTTTAPNGPTATAPTNTSAPTSGGTGGELQRILQEFSRFLDWLGRVIDRIGRFVDRLSNTISNYL